MENWYCNKVCHFSKKANGMRIHSWGEFVEGNCHGEMVRYHPIIPFKNYSKIARQIAWAEEKRFWEDNYNLNNRNCEHFANMIVYGINYSEQIYRKFPWGNNGKGSTINLGNEIDETSNMFGWTTPRQWRAAEILERIEIPPKENCRIM